MSAPYSDALLAYFEAHGIDPQDALKAGAVEQDGRLTLANGRSLNLYGTGAHDPNKRADWLKDEIAYVLQEAAYAEEGPVLPPPSRPLEVARELLEAQFSYDQTPTLLHWRGGWWK